MSIKDLFDGVDAKKIIAWFKAHEPQAVSVAITDLQTAAAVSGKFLTWAKSPQGVTIEAVVASAVPQGKAWTAEAVTIATALAVDMAACINPASWKGIALRLGAEVLFIIDGGKLPTGIDGYLKELQDIFVG